MSVPEVKEGAVFTVKHPFVRDDYHGLDECGPFATKTWAPGVRNELVPPDDCEAVADAEGWQELTVVSVHKPGRYPTRVFYTRKWVSPAGKRFGKTNLHIATLPKFRRLVRGYRHPYRLLRAEAA